MGLFAAVFVVCVVLPILFLGGIIGGCKVLKDPSRENSNSSPSTPELVSSDEPKKELVVKTEQPKKDEPKPLSDEEKKAIAEKERITKEKAEKERIAEEKAEADRIANIQAEKDRLAKEAADKIAKQKEKDEELAANSLKQIKNLVAMGKIAAAKSSLAGLVKNYPATKAAGEAGDLLKRLNE